MGPQIRRIDAAAVGLVRERFAHESEHGLAVSQRFAQIAEERRIEILALVEQLAE
jgi:hypothetical protein